MNPSSYSGLWAVESSQAREDLSSKVARCVCITFESLGLGHATQQNILWGLSEDRKLGLSDIADRPGEFMEGLRAMCGDSGAAVFEQRLMREIVRESGFASPNVREIASRGTLPELLQFLAHEIAMRPTARRRFEGPISSAD